jgi:hypothetical protein
LKIIFKNKFNKMKKNIEKFEFKQFDQSKLNRVIGGKCTETDNGCGYSTDHYTTEKGKNVVDGSGSGDCPMIEVSSDDVLRITREQFSFSRFAF